MAVTGITSIGYSTYNKCLSDCGRLKELIGEVQMAGQEIRPKLEEDGLWYQELCPKQKEGGK